MTNILDGIIGCAKKGKGSEQLDHNASTYVEIVKVPEAECRFLFLLCSDIFDGMTENFSSVLSLHRGTHQLKISLNIRKEETLC